MTYARLDAQSSNARAINCKVLPRSLNPQSDIYHKASLRGCELIIIPLSFWTLDYRG